MAAVAEVIASAFASGMSWAGTIEGHPLYCPPPIGTFTGNQAMSILESFIADHPETTTCRVCGARLSKGTPAPSSFSERRFRRIVAESV